MDFLDPRIVDLITYVDAKGIRRVKPPYKNKHVLIVIVNQLDGNGNFVLPINLGLAQKAIFLNLPNGEHYDYSVDVPNKLLTVLKPAIGTYMEVTILDPKPLPKTGEESIWDSLPYDSQKSLVVAWSDMICNATHVSEVDSEWEDFDEVFRLFVGFRKNCGNFKGADWGRPKAPRNVDGQGGCT